MYSPTALPRRLASLGLSALLVLGGTLSMAAPAAAAGPTRGSTTTPVTHPVTLPTETPAPVQPVGSSGTLHPLGYVPSGGTVGLKARAQQLMNTMTAYPAAVDLSAYAPPVGNQGAVGSCTSWATGYYMRYWLRDHALGDTTQYAPMFLYAQIAHGVDQGSSFPSNYTILDTQGIAPQSVYTQGNFDYTTQPTAAEKTAAASYKATSYAQLFYGANASNQLAIEAAMAAGSPVNIAIPVYPEFDSVNSGNGYLVNSPTAGESSRGAHALFAVKYDARGVWIENSWGTYWGNAGWAELSWDFINRYAYEAWTLSSSSTDVNSTATAIYSFSPTSGTVGTAVTISGQNFTGATTVKFNGVAATSFSVDSGSQITATVPAGATSGTIGVTAPAGSATSPTPFTVMPPPAFSALAASPAAIKFDPNGYCPTGVKATTITATTKTASATATGATSVTLYYTRADGSSASSPMSVGTVTATTTTWTASLSTVIDRSLTAGAVSFYAIASSAGGQTTRYPATGTKTFAITTCANVAPTIASVGWTASGPVYSNPLGTGVVPAGGTTTVTFAANGVADTDGVATAVLALSGAGLAAPVTVPLAGSSGTWSAAVNLSAIGVKAGILSWNVKATDALGMTSPIKAGTTVAVSRADTAGTASITGITSTTGKIIITATADDADAVWGATSSTAKANIVWAANYTDAAGNHVVVNPVSVVPAYKGSHVYVATISAPWATTAITNLSVAAVLSLTDPYSGSTTSATVTSTVVPVGPAVIASIASTAANVPLSTNPLGSGAVPSGAATTVTFTADVRDTDAVTGVVVSYAGGGVTPARTFPLAYDAATKRWTGTLDLSSSGIITTSTIAWSIIATDAAANATTARGTPFAVTRADSPGSVSVTNAVVDTAGNIVLTLTATDPDAVTKVTLAWYGTAGTTTYLTRTATATLVSGSTYTVKLIVGTPLLTAKSGSFTFTPSVTDKYGKVTAGSTSTITPTLP